jgi:hypothetical protein
MLPSLMRILRRVWVCSVVAAIAGIGGSAQQQVQIPPLVTVRPIQPPKTPLPSETASSGQRRFSFIAYGDTRSQVDGQTLQPDHGVVVDSMVAIIKSLASTPLPVRFVLQSGDAVLNGINGTALNISFSPLIERITRGAGVPYFFAVGNHDVDYLPDGTTRSLGLHNTLAALSKLIPAEGSARRLNGYPTYAFGYGNLFAIAIDSNIPNDRLQLAWVTDQLEHLDRSRYRHVIAFFHHPLFSSGYHGGPDPTDLMSDEERRSRAAIAAMRSLYGPLFRRYHVRMVIAGHDHLYDHWVERYTDGGTSYRRDDILTGGGGAPIYTYRGEPDVQSYIVAGAERNVRLEHLMKPGTTPEENPHHFVVIRVDGDRLSLEVVGTGPTPYRPYNGQSRIDLNDPS